MTWSLKGSLIGHYVCTKTEYLAEYDQPVLNREGKEFKLGISEHGGHCGIWVEKDGSPIIEMSGQFAGAGARE